MPYPSHRMPAMTEPLDLRITCASCNQPMTVIHGKLPKVQLPGFLANKKRACNAHESEPDHPHVRCENCSPPWFYACVKIEVRPLDEPA